MSRLDMDGERDVLGCWVGPTGVEAAKFSMTVRFRRRERCRPLTGVRPPVTSRILLRRYGQTIDRLTVGTLSAVKGRSGTGTQAAWWISVR